MRYNGLTADRSDVTRDYGPARSKGAVRVGGIEFAARVASSPDLAILYQSDLGYIIQHKPSGRACAIRADAVHESSWDDLDGVLAWKRPASVMTHISRVVGYYSMIRNWNGSKLAELRDRHRGSYALPEPAAQ